MKYVHGVIDSTDQYRGWITGSFYPEGTIQHETNIEVKVDMLSKSISFASHYHSSKKTWTIVLQGAMHMNVDGSPLTIAAGEYLIFEPGVSEELLSTEENTIIVSIHTPSGVMDKVDL